MQDKSTNVSDKVKKGELLDDISKNFHTYFKKGVRVDKVVGDAHPELDIEDIESLLRIYFVLSHQAEENKVDVLEFMRKLKKRIRHIKTTTTRETELNQGDVQGHVDWQQTIKKRSRRGRPEVPLFICRTREEHYDIRENLVLKRLLTIIHEIVYKDLDDFLSDPNKYDWFTDWTEGREGEESPREVLEKVYKENVYLQRISIEENKISDRDIETVKRSRDVLYRESAELLGRYGRLMNQRLNEEEARELLDNSMIIPETEDTLFELHWVFKLLDCHDNVKYKIITQDDPSLIAEWEENGDRYVIHHDSSGSSSVDFSDEADDDPEEGYYHRLHQATKQWEDLSSKIFDKKDFSQSRMPDIVLEKYPSQDSGFEKTPSQILIGEVKYTKNPDYASTGLRQLLEYMAFIKGGNDEYIEESPLEYEDIRGMLFVDRLNTSVEPVEEIDLVEYGDDLCKEDII
jgi:hypothetical protein